MSKYLLPIGSVVLLKEGKKKLMICGRIQVREGSDKIYDYSACLYPEGLLGPNSIFFFNDEDINRVYFIGFQDEEEIIYNGERLSNLGELELRDGVIVEKDNPEEPSETSGLE